MVLQGALFDHSDYGVDIIIILESEFLICQHVPGSAIKARVCSRISTFCTHIQKPLEISVDRKKKAEELSTHLQVILLVFFCFIQQIA